jgi:NADH:ubiquinone oxidoreductase subunit 6 (subunit J)
MNGLQAVGSIIGLIIFVYMCYEVWRSPMGTGGKVGWTIFSFFCTLIALIVWLVTGRRRAYGTS